MKSKLPEYYLPDFSNLWKSCTFVFDANVLLHLYRFTDASRDQFFSILGKYQDRVWLPHQFALEFHRNRPTVIQEQFVRYAFVEAQVTKCMSDLSASFKDSPSHPFIDSTSIITPFESAHKAVLDVIAAARKSHPNFLHGDDSVLARIDAIFEGNIGTACTPEESESICKAAQQRYRDKVPPGYKDIEKKQNAYGDYIGWSQILAYAKANKKSVVLISEDRKEDWWWKVPEGNITVGPRPELRKEFFDVTGCEFYLYRLSPFLEYAAKTGPKTEEASTLIKEIKEIHRLLSLPNPGVTSTIVSGQLSTNASSGMITGGAVFKSTSESDGSAVTGDSSGDTGSSGGK